MVWVVLPNGQGNEPRQQAMGSALEHVIPRPTKRVLMVADDPWLRLRLRRELERAGCEVVVLTLLRPGTLTAADGYDVVLTDAALFPEGSRLEALRALRAGSSQARFILLVGPAERGVAAQAEGCGFDLVWERPAQAAALKALVREMLSGPREKTGHEHHLAGG